jgi:hypothetical protein
LVKVARSIVVVGLYGRMSDSLMWIELRRAAAFFLLNTTPRCTWLLRSVERADDLALGRSDASSEVYALIARGGAA